MVYIFSFVHIHNLYAFPSIKVIKSWRMRWVGHVAYTGHEKCHKFWLENLKGRDYSECLGIE